MLAYGKLLRELGFSVSFVLDERYLAFAGFSAVGAAIPAGSYVPAGNQFEIALFYNAAAGNPALARRMRAFGARVLYIFHEPESIWNLLGEGWRQIVRFPFSTLSSIATLCVSSAVIVPSQCARSLYDRHYRRYNGNVFTLPLLLDDEIDPARFEQARGSRRYFGFIGSASKGHGIDEFVAFAKYAIRSGSTIPFVIATRRSLSGLLRKDEEFSRLAGAGRILVRHGRVLSNDEINQWYLNCFGVWNVYRRSTQSGVLPRAYMAGTPVLARRIGSFPEYVREGSTGEFVDSGCEPAAILVAAEGMRKQFPVYADGCRRMFLETFHYQANGKRLAAILDEARLRTR
jgi:glycosyltransferase involved in cell wall biosynthesis